MAVGLLILATAALRNAVPAISTGRVGPAGHSTTVDLRQLNSFRGGSTATTSGAELEWHDLTFTVKDGAKTILSSCNGRAARGRMLAIMGPSGGGKTTLLNALAGNLKEGKRTALTGQLLCDGEACGGAAEVSGLRMAFVAQEDTFYTQMTVRETLMFAARLRLPDSVSLVEKTRRVDEIISKLSLVKAADTVIGDVKRRGISGGERKRLAIGCELLSDPQLLFLDEPTSGLDSFAALKVVQSLKRLTAEGCTVVMSIHQPRGSIYNLFDDLLLLSEGRVVYNGAAAEAASHFGRRGFKCPPTINAGEFVVDLVSTSYASAEEEEASHARILDLEAAAKHALAAAGIKRATTGKSAAASEAASAAAAGARRGVGRRVAGGSRWTQFRLLFKRAWGEVARSKAAIIIKATQQVMIALIYGGIYSLNDAQSSIQDRFGLLSLIAIGAGNLAIASTIRTFPKEKAIVTNERAKGMCVPPSITAEPPSSCRPFTAEPPSSCRPFTGTACCPTSLPRSSRRRPSRPLSPPSAASPSTLCADSTPRRASLASSSSH